MSKNSAKKADKFFLIKMFFFQGAKLINIHYICSEIFIIFILKIFKNIAIKNRIQKNLKKRANYLNGNKLQIHKVGCIVDIEEVDKVDFLKNFIKEYGINSENYVILGYEEKGIDIQIEGTGIWPADQLFFHTQASTAIAFIGSESQATHRSKWYRSRFQRCDYWDSLGRWEYFYSRS